MGHAVGYNESADPAVEKLQFADDDAVRNFQLLTLFGADAILLTEFDGATRDIYPQLRPRSPSLANLQTALAELNSRMTAAKKAGRRTVLYFFYGGHGDVYRGEGYVNLKGERFTRSRLLSFIKDSKADVNHVIVDACKSYFLVFERGPGGRREQTDGGFLNRVSALPANTGVLLSSSAAQDSHEWEAFQGGVFSHEVRSALQGAADLDGDHRVTYEEAEAFIFTANQAIPNQRFRPRVFSRPNGNQVARSAILMDLRPVSARHVVFGPPVSRRHYYVEDAIGIRYLDLHPGNSQLSIYLPRGRQLYVRDESAKTEFVLPEGDAIVLSQLAASRNTSRVRGAEHVSFRNLFSMPFDESALVRFRQRPVDVCPPEFETAHHVRDWLRPTMGATALAALAVGGLFTGLAAYEKGSANEHTSNAEFQEKNRIIRRNNAIAITGYAVGGALALGYLVWQFWPERKPSAARSLRLPSVSAQGVSWSW